MHFLNDLSDTFSLQSEAPQGTAALLNASESWAHFLEKQEHFQVPETERLNRLMPQLPRAAAQVVLDQLLPTALKQTDPVSFEKHALGVWFTMSRVNALLKSGDETINVERGKVLVDNPHNYEFEAYMGTDGPPMPVHRRISIEDIFTIFRDGKPFIYKAKYHPARQFGAVEKFTVGEKESERNAYHDHNQLLKYQAAIDHGLISGAAMEIRGRIDLDFLEWACGTNVFNPGAVPDVQIIYNMMLPSGAEYRFTLKKASDPSKELNVENDRSSYTADDEAVIKGLDIALENPSQWEVYKLVSGHDVVKSTPLSKKFNDVSVNTPDSIRDPALFAEYNRVLREGLWDRARAIKPENYNLNDNTIFVTKNLGIENDTARLGQIVEDYQEYLRKDPELSKTKANYILGHPGSPAYEKNKARVVHVFAKNLSLIRASELARRAAPEYQELAAQRVAMGWKGPEEGIGLSLDHIMFDSIAETMAEGMLDKKGRSYENPQERFMNIDAVMAHLEKEQDRVVVQITYYDPQAKAIDPKKKKVSTHYKDASEQKLMRLKKDMVRENIKRALAYLDKTYPDDGMKRKMSIERRAYESRKDEIDALREQLTLAKDTAQETAVEQGSARRKLGIRQLPDEHPLMSRQKAVFEHLNKTEDELWAKLEPIFEEGLRRKMFAQVFSRRENVMKFIYAVRSDNTVVYDEEARGNGTGMRASHSELVGGEFSYGAGELVFKRNEFQKSWIMTEINNGSGHYRPPTQSLEFASNIILGELNEHFQRKGQTPLVAEESVRTLANTCRPTDAIARGRYLKDAEVGAFRKGGSAPCVKTQAAAAPPVASVA